MDDAFIGLAKKVIDQVEGGKYNLEDTTIHGIKVGRDRRELNLKGPPLRSMGWIEHVKALLTCEMCKNPTIN